jgi:hypothetical protein
MNSILVTPRRRSEGMGRILAIESDPARSRTLGQILRGYVGAELEIVGSVEQAIRSIDSAVPDLVVPRRC